MSGVMVRGNFPKLQRPGIKALFGLTMKEGRIYHPEMFEMGTSDKNYEEDVEVGGFGLIPIKNESSPITFDSMTQLAGYKYRHDTYAGGFIVSMEELQDNLYLRPQQRTKALARSARVTKEVVAANIFNRGFDSSVTYADGIEAFSTAHVTLSGAQQNELTIAANFSEKAVEDLCILIRKAQDTRGIEMQLSPEMVMVPPDLEFEAIRVLESEKQNNTANNAINALKASGRFPQGILVNEYLTSDSAFFIKTDCPDGFKGYQRMVAEFGEYDDGDTLNMKYFYAERYKFGVSNWRYYYASPGI